MSTKVHSASTSAQAPTEDLGAVLALPPSELERRANTIISELNLTSRGALGVHAPRLLALLEDPAFGTGTAGGLHLREAVVQAVVRAGYPFATQLTPDDLRLSRGKTRALRGVTTRRRAVWVALALVPALIGFGAWFQLRAQRLERLRALDPEAYLQVQLASRTPLPILTAAEVVPDAPQQLIEAIRHETSRDAIAERGLECLALGWEHREGCLGAVADGLEDFGAARSVPDTDTVAGSIRGLLRQAIVDPADFREQARPVTEWLEGFAKLPSRPVPPSEGFLEKREAVIRGELTGTRLEDDGFDSRTPGLLREARGCLDCQLTLLTANRLWTELLDGEARSRHLLALEELRIEIARTAAHDRRYDCLRLPDPSPTRPLGCP